jgi:hypothetical protein
MFYKWRDGEDLNQLTTYQVFKKALVSAYADTFPFMTADNLLPCFSLSSLSKPLCRRNNYSRQSLMPCSSLFAVSGAACLPMSRKLLEQVGEWSVISHPLSSFTFLRTQPQAVPRFSYLVLISCSACSVSYNCNKSIVLNVVWLLFMTLSVTRTVLSPHDLWRITGKDLEASGRSLSRYYPAI